MAEAPFGCWVLIWWELSFRDQLCNLCNPDRTSSYFCAWRIHSSSSNIAISMSGSLGLNGEKPGANGTFFQIYRKQWWQSPYTENTRRNGGLNSRKLALRWVYMGVQLSFWSPPESIVLKDALRTLNQDIILSSIHK